MARVSDPNETDQGSVQQPQNGKTIILAEDDPFISRMYQTKLEYAGYTVTVANNGRDAYEQIKASLPNLIMLDINMPELSGFDVIRTLQADGIELDPGCIMVLTNSANPADRKAATALGADYYVKAELTPHEVLDRINQKLGIFSGPS